MPRITIEWFEGRTIDQKRKLAKLITDAMLEVDKSLKSQDVTLVFREMSKSNDVTPTRVDESKREIRSMEWFGRFTLL
jgi:phenylpyruvate tautomerase PptA (4-oxalocrotonate tautomerase family)